MLLKFLGKHRDLGLLILRLGVGAIYIMHGLPKLVGGPKLWTSIGHSMGHLGIHWIPVFWGFMAAVTEGIGGVLLILGALYRPTCLLLAFVMTVATLTVFHEGFKGYGYPLTMVFVFVGLACVGPGRFSVDKD
jgi:putative oxidoreductase